MLVVDRYKSYPSWQVVQYCLNHCIRLLCLPLHSTYELQPLDVGVFSSLQAYYNDAVNDWIYEHETGSRDRIREAKFLRLYLQARKKAFTADCIKQAFKSTGISPLNTRKGLPPPLPAASDTTTTSIQTPRKKQDIVALALRLQKQLHIDSMAATAANIELLT